MEIKGISGQYQGQIIPVNGSIVFGRDPQCCSLLYPVGTDGVSRIHCRLTLEGGKYTLTDLGSSYGTFVNGTKLQPNVPVLLNNGDTFCLGNPGNSFSVSNSVIPETSAPIMPKIQSIQQPQQISPVPEKSTNSKASSEVNKPDNSIIVECNPHWMNSIAAVIVGLIFLLLGFAVHPILLLGSVGIFIYVAIVLRSTRLYLTHDNVVGKLGILNTQEMMSPIRKVQDISISQNIWGKVFGFADITISTAGGSGSEYVFRGMSNYNKFKSEFLRLSAQYD